MKHPPTQQRKLAIILALVLALAALPAQANGPFVRRDLSVNDHSKPAFADLDADGDLDALVGSLTGGAVFYRNVGTADSPAFREEYEDDLGLRFAITPAFVDIDADGDLDAFSGTIIGGMIFARNIGTPAAPRFSFALQPTVPQSDYDWRTPAFVDVDADGDQDAFIGTRQGDIDFLLNIGSPTSPTLVLQSQDDNPLAGTTTSSCVCSGYSHVSPTFVDADGDGDFDAFIGHNILSYGGGVVDYFRNEGTPAVPRFVRERGLNPLAGVRVNEDPHPALVDIDADGRLDAFIGRDDGSVAFFRNQLTITTTHMAQENVQDELLANSASFAWPSADLVDIDADGDLDAFVVSDNKALYYRNTGSAAEPRLIREPREANPLATLTSAFDRNLAFADLDADGDYDAFASAAGKVQLYRNGGTPLAPSFALADAADNPLALIDVEGAARLAFVDLDADADLDALVGTGAGQLLLYHNQGQPGSPSFALAADAPAPFDGADLGDDIAPAVVDVDADADLDLLLGTLRGPFLFYRNQGTPQAPAFTQEDGRGNPFFPLPFTGPTYTTTYKSSLTFGDLDADGDQDALLALQGGPQGGKVHFYRNHGTGTRFALERAPSPGAPFDGTSTGIRSNIALGDLDADGDLDIALGQENGTMRYFQNAGTPSAPALSERLGQDSPLAGLDTGAFANPAFVDVDGDGDLDLFVGIEEGTIRFFRNAGSPQTPTFTAAEDANPLGGVDVGSNAGLDFGDVDGDGDPDVALGHRYSTGVVQFYRNTGSPSSPVYTLVAGQDDPFFTSRDDFTSNYVRTPAFADADGDGDLDYVVTDDLEVMIYDNLGTPASPKFTRRSEAQNPFYPLPERRNTLTLDDLDADGDLDVFLGDLSGVFDFYRTISTTTLLMEYEAVSWTPLQQLSGTPTLADIDGDGDLDAFVIKGEVINFYEQVQTPLGPRFIERPHENPIDGFRLKTLALADLDADGDLDAASGAWEGPLHFFRNVGTASAAAFVEETGAASPLGAILPGAQSDLRFVDVDGDDDDDLFVLGSLPNSGQAVRFYRNTGGPTTPLFVEQTGGDNPLHGISSHALPSFGDVDGDGDLDAYAQANNEGFFRNVGTSSAPSFAQEIGVRNPFIDQVEWPSSTPIFGDVDGDGDLDAFIGRSTSITFLRNQGPHPALLLQPQLNSLAPLADERFGYEAHPILGDIDSDGDLDLFVGTQLGTVVFFRNAGSASSPDFVAEASPLGPGFITAGAAPTLVDIDADGDLDAFIGNLTGKIQYWRNTGSAGSPTFERQLGAANPLDSVGGSHRAAATFADLDADGDLDALVKAGAGLSLYRNTGSASAPSFTYIPGPYRQFKFVVVLSQSYPVFADIDGDHDADLFVGHEDGTFDFYRNVETQYRRGFVPDAGLLTRLDAIDMGEDGRAAFGDLDGDGDLDALLAGQTGITASQLSMENSLRFLENLNQPIPVQPRAYLPLLANE